MASPMPFKERNEQPAMECRTPPLPNHHKTEPRQNSVGSDTTKTSSCKCKPSQGLLGTSNRLKVPKPFKYPERYTSPTDHIMSPMSRRLLARSRRGSSLLPPTKIQSKINELRAPEPGQVQVRSDQ